MKVKGLGRAIYSKDKVKQLRKNRMSLKAKDSK
jgi:hypothetical protein